MNEICADCGAPVRSHPVTGGGQPGTTYACGRDKGGSPTVPCLERQVAALRAIAERLRHAAGDVIVNWNMRCAFPEMRCSVNRLRDEAIAAAPEAAKEQS